MARNKSFSKGSKRAAQLSDAGVEVYDVDKGDDIEVYSKPADNDAVGKNEDFKEPESILSNNRGDKMNKIVQKLLTIALAIAVVTVAAVILSRQDPLAEARNEYLKLGEGYVFGVSTIPIDGSGQALGQLGKDCKDVKQDEFLIAQIANPSTGDVISYVINKGTGKLECKARSNLSVESARTVSETQVLATVNGAPAYGREVLAIYNSVPQSLRTNSTLQQAFEQVVYSKLLEQEAQRMGLTVSQEELETEINNFLTVNGLTLQALNQALQEARSSLADFKQQMTTKVLIQKAVLELTQVVQQATEEDARNYYNQFKSNITSAGRASVRQLTINADQSNSVEKLEYTKQIASLFNGDNLCDLIADYSEDLPTKNSCGTIEFQQGQVLPEYELAVFESNPQEVKIIGSRIGYHLVQIVSVEKPRPLSFEESKSGIISFLTSVNKQQALAQYMQQLRREAVIDTSG
jgi:parvulin-like peptidyl-prolyl isomerase